jgi:toluene monooxygenase system protein E
MEKEIFVDCILEEIEASGYDRELQPQWAQTVATLVAPFRYPGHALMMIAAYVAQMAPGGRIVVAATFQAGDEARQVERLAYRHAGNRCASSWTSYSSPTIGARHSWL